jgi:hypothetical protein
MDGKSVANMYVAAHINIVHQDPIDNSLKKAVVLLSEGRPGEKVKFA